MSATTLVLFNLVLLFAVSVCDDVPCAQRQKQFGGVCVCNSSYCDTVERPPPLSGGRYYRYTTSSDRPGFHRTTGQFQQTVPKDISANYYLKFTVNPNVQYQEILGFGGSFSDSVGIVVNSLPPEVQDKFMESYFGTSGLEYSMGRVVIGMSDFSTRNYSYDDVENDDEMKNFSLTVEDYKYKIPFIKKAMSISPHKLKLVGCSFSAPGWMKTTNSTRNGYIKRSHLHGWAKYHVKFLDEYAKQNIPFWALTGGNEVVILFMIRGLLPIGSTAMPHDHIVWVRDHLAPQLAASNHSDVKFLMMDDMRPFANYWLSRFARVPEAYKLVEGVGLHWYFDWFTNASIADRLHYTFPDKLIVYTESSANIILFGGQPVELGSWQRASLYAYNIIENLNHWTNGYIDWNLALNTDGGPYLFLSLDAPVIVNTTGGEFYKNPMFYVMGHFSKFIPPGSRRVDVKTSQQRPPVDQRSNQRQEKSTRSSYRRDVNDESKETESSYLRTATHPNLNYPFPFPVPFVVPKTVTCVATVNSNNSSSVIVFNGMDTDVNVTIEDTVSGYITATLTANSLNTFVYWPQK